MTHDEEKRTTYTISNNSADGPSTPLFIEHSADPSHEGYAIVTSERAVKTTTAFTRFPSHPSSTADPWPRSLLQRVRQPNTIAVT